MSKTTKNTREELRGQVRLRQGDVIEFDPALLQLNRHPTLEEAAKAKTVIVVSHDCDIEAEARKEPFVEVIPISLIDKVEARNTHTRNARTLDIQAQASFGEKCQGIRIGASHKQQIQKESLWGREFVRPYSLAPNDLIELADWLSARYRRAALPEEFGRRFGKIEDDFWKLFRNRGQDLLAILLYFDEGQEKKECNEDEPYSLSISLVLPKDKVECEPDKLVEEVRALFETRFENSQSNDPPEIELRQCLAISEGDITLEAYKAGVFLRSEWISYGTDPHGPIVGI